MMIYFAIKLVGLLLFPEFRIFYFSNYTLCNTGPRLRPLICSRHLADVKAVAVTAWVGVTKKLSSVNYLDVWL